jgi:hypothetical protein
MTSRPSPPRRPFPLIFDPPPGGLAPAEFRAALAARSAAEADVRAEAAAAEAAAAAPEEAAARAAREKEAEAR